MTSIALARRAMRTRFEIVLHGDDPIHLRAAGEEALDEIERVEARLSLFRPTSEIAAINARAAQSPVRVSPETLRLLQHAARLSTETGGAFDITVAPLMRAWGFIGGNGHPAEPEQLAEARACTGMHLVELDASTNTVRFVRPGVMLDLGAIGKGYAVDCAAETLREAGVTSAFIHGGTSTIYALGKPMNAPSWKVAVEQPKGSPDQTPLLLTQVELHDESLSMSAVWGKSFQHEGRTLGHVLDPRTGQPADHALLAVVASVSATDTDALSTALMIRGASAIDEVISLREGMRALVVGHPDDCLPVHVTSRALDIPGAA